MIKVTEPYDIVVMETAYRVTQEVDEDVRRICVYSDGLLRFSLPDDTPHDEVEKFIKVYALGFADGRDVSAAVSKLARRLGRAVGKARSA